MAQYSICGSSGGNTGSISCDKRRGIPEVLTLGGKVFEPADYANATAFQAAFTAAINLANGDPDKLYPFPLIQNITDNTEENTVGTTGKGFRMILKEGKPAYTFGVLAGSTQERNMRKFNNQIVPVYIFDNARDIDGMLDTDGNFVGHQALIFCDGKPYSDGNTIDNEYTNVEVSFLSAADFFDNFAFIKTTFSAAALEGLIDGTLYEAAAAVAEVFQIGLKVVTPELGKVYSLYSKYADELADDALFVAGTGTNFATPLAIASVAKNDVTGCWTVTFDDVTFTALPAGTKIQLKLVSPTLLLAAGVRGVEGIPVILTKAA